MVFRKIVVSSLERLISRLWIVGLSRVWMVAILGFGALKRRARYTVKHRRDLSGMIYSWIDRSAGRVPDKMNIGRSSERLYIR